MPGRFALRGGRPCALQLFCIMMKEEGNGRWHEAFCAGAVSEERAVLPAQFYQPDVRGLHVFLCAGHVLAGKRAARLCGLAFRQGHLHCTYLGPVLRLLLWLHGVFMRAGHQCQKPEMDQRCRVLFTAGGLFYNFFVYIFGGRKYAGGHCAVFCLFCGLLCQRGHVEPAVRPDGGHFHPQKCRHILRRL